MRVFDEIILFPVNLTYHMAFVRTDLFNSEHQFWMYSVTLEATLANKFSVPLDVLLRESNTVSIHTRNLRLLVIEIYKALNQLSPALMWNTFNEWTSGYNLRRMSSLQVPRIQTAMGSNTFDFRASLAWNNLPARLKFLNETELFLREVYIRISNSPVSNCRRGGGGLIPFFQKSD